MKISHFALLLPLLLASACTTPPPPPGPIVIEQNEKLSLDVKQILLVDRTAGQTPRSVDIGEFKPTVDDAVRGWVKKNLQGVGLEGQASFTIGQAYITEQPIRVEHHWYERQLGSKLVGHIEIAIEAEGRQGYGLATATVSREVTMLENPCDEEKREAYTKLLNGMLSDLAMYVNKGIQNNLKDFVVTAPLIDSQSVSAPVLQP